MPFGADKLLAAVFQLWRLFRISGLIPFCCRFLPTCSHYAEQALLRHGLVFGLALFFRRLIRCHPWHPGGWDPVP